MTPIYVTIDQEKTGRNIASLMALKGIRVKDIQEACGFEKPQAVYKWLHGQTLPSIDNLLILSILFETDMKGILAVSGDALHRFRRPIRGRFCDCHGYDILGVIPVM